MPVIDEKEIPLSPLDQVMLRNLARSMALFPFPDPSCREEATEQLRASLEMLIRKWPFLCGGVYDEPGEERAAFESNGGTTKSFKQAGRKVFRYPTELPANLEQAGLLQVTTCTKEEFPYTYADLAATGVPTEVLKSGLFFHVPLSPSYTERRDPAFQMKITFFDGGLALAICGHHTVMDGFSIARIVTQFAGFCHAVGKRMLMDEQQQKESGGRSCQVPETVACVEEEIIDRTAVVERLTVERSPNFEKLLSSCPDFTHRDISGFQPYHDKTVGSTCRMFVFSGETVETLKKVLNEQVIKKPSLVIPVMEQYLGRKTEVVLESMLKSGRPPLTSYACLSALLWHYLTLARLPHLDPDEDSVFYNPVELRSRGVVPKSCFPGTAIVSSATRPLSVRTVADTTDPPHAVLTRLAAHILGSILQVDETFLARRIELFSSAADISRLCSTGEASGRQRAGLLANNWSSFAMTELEFGIVGASSSKPACVRKPWAPIEGYALIMPRSKGPEHDWEVYLGFRGEDGERLLDQEKGLAALAKRVTK